MRKSTGLASIALAVLACGALAYQISLFDGAFGGAAGSSPHNGAIATSDTTAGGDEHLVSGAHEFEVSFAWWAVSFRKGRSGIDEHTLRYEPTAIGLLIAQENRASTYDQTGAGYYLHSLNDFLYSGPNFAGIFGPSGSQGSGGSGGGGSGRSCQVNCAASAPPVASSPLDIANIGSMVPEILATNSAGLFDTPSVPTVIVDTTLNTGEAVVAIPEPATWVMLILGFAGVGVLAYRRRRLDAYACHTA